MRREYPKQPIVGVGVVIVRPGEILLVRRGSEPGKHRWSVPGGLVELGETVHETIAREVKEETNLDVRVDRLIDVVDNLVPDETGKLRFHFIILDFFADPQGGQLRAGSDVLNVKWVPFHEVETYNLTETFRRFFERNRGTLEQYGSDTKP